MWGIVIGLISGALMSVQGVFNSEVTKQSSIWLAAAFVQISAFVVCVAAWFYYPYYTGFNLATLLANWLKLVCFNFPFAFFSQLFFIQPLIRTVFRALFRK